MAVYLLSTNFTSEQNAHLEARIRKVIPDLTRITNMADIAQNVRGPGPVYVLFAAPSGDSHYINTLIDIAGRHRAELFFILISDDISASDYKRLVRSGGADWVSTAGAPDEILDIIRKRGAPSEQAEAAGREPVVIAFVPSAGGVGNAKLTTEIGVRLKTDKASRDRRICLVDLDLQTSHVCAYLDIEPRLRIEEIARAPERLDSHLFEIFKSRHSSGLEVIAAPRGKFNYDDLTLGALDALFDMIAASYDLILIDLPIVWLSWTREVVANSDAVVVTGLNTVPCLHQIAETLTDIRSNRQGDTSVAVVINRCQSRLFGGIARRQHVQHVLAREKVFYVRDDPAAALESINTGAPIVTGSASSKIAKDIKNIAEFCANITSARVAFEQRSPTAKAKS